jgi:hypothetical protein
MPLLCLEFVFWFWKHYKNTYNDFTYNDLTYNVLHIMTEKINNI